MVSDAAKELAAQAWCRKGTSNKRMDPLLAGAFAEILEEQRSAAFANCQEQIMQLCEHIVKENVRREECLQWDDGWNSAYKAIHSIVAAMTPNVKSAA